MTDPILPNPRELERNDQIVELGMALTLITAAGVGYWWKGWKGAVGVPVGLTAAFLGVVVTIGNR